MDAQIRISGGDEAGEYAALLKWLYGEDELRGRIRTANGPIGETDLGPAVQLLTVALGTGGTGTVLASSLKIWLKSRKTTAKITVESSGRSVSLDIETADEVAPLLEQILRVRDNG
jgi:Effector Associated Constant Component 1